MKRAIIAGLLVSFLSAGPSEAGGDAEAGKAVFRKCATCHSTGPVNRVGPSLQGIVGRPVAAIADFSYSQAMRSFAADGKRWDENRLAEYLVAPRAMVPGTAMTFPGLRKPQDIADLIAYLKDSGAAH
ncbi:cytochrome c family protein [Sinorhizobium sp. BG8]|uniref:c-type cytochrome n=1 Tax=Sinorhizobium sp. BG8 TaxID=2613773 RepID=UPI00193DE96F|nr:cytochrome c family protein [Sinorhizobium sp. BG8]QRM56340.1 cytochrome c family protein [Sinorhizobium sp. BG8]